MQRRALVERGKSDLSASACTPPGPTTPLACPTFTGCTSGTNGLGERAEAVRAPRIVRGRADGRGEGVGVPGGTASQGVNGAGAVERRGQGAAEQRSERSLSYVSEAAEEATQSSADRQRPRMKHEAAPEGAASMLSR